MTRMEWLISENARLDALSDQLRRGIIPAPIMSMDPILIDDGTGGFWTAPARKTAHLGRAWTDGPIARALHSDNETLFSDCPHCHKLRFSSEDAPRPAGFGSGGASAR